jgi:tripartite-type tricarboxylate transporter receptor subunit TctC
MERRHGSVRAALIVTALMALAAPVARAETYPSRPVRLVLPFGAGGVADISARVVADKLGDQLGQRFIVDNQPGAGGIAAARNALAAPRDGYTLSLLTNATAISVPLFNNLPFDPLKDFTPISTLGYFDCLFVTNAASEFQSLPDFLKVARAKPGALNVGTVNPGSTQHLTAELFKSTAGVDFVIVPFRTTPEAVLALLRGDIQMVIDFYAGLKPGLVDGKTRAIAWSASSRSPALPDVPTVQEGGVAGFNVTSWNALYAPAGDPPEVVETINRSLRTVLADPDVKRRLLDLGIDSRASTPAELDAQIRADIKKWAGVIERAGIAKQ